MTQPSALPKKTSDRLRLVARFLGKPAAVTLGLGFLGSSMLALAEFGVALFIQIFLVALGIMTQPPSGFLGSFAISLPLAGLFLAAVAGFRSCGQFLVILSSSKSMALMQQRLRLTLCADLLHNTSPPDRTLTQSLLSEVFPKSSLLAQNSAMCFSAVVQMLALTIAMLVVAWQETAVASVFLLLVGLVVLRLNKTVRRIADDLPTQQASIVDSIERIAANWLLVVVLNTRDREFLRVRKAVDDQTASANHAYLLGSAAAALAPYLGIMILIGVILLSQNTFNTAPTRLLIFLYLFVRFVQNLSQAAATFGIVSANFGYFLMGLRYFGSSEPRFRRAIVGQSAPDAAHQKEPTTQDPAAALPVAITCRNITFHYDSSNSNPVLHNFSLDVLPGEQVGIIGPSGSGKSTLLFLLLGVLKPQNGRIELNGIAATEAIHQNLCRIAYVGPEPYLFEGTVRENLLYGLAPTAEPPIETMAEVLTSLDLGRENLKATQQFLDSKVQAGGRNFSTGQKQRLCFARAILSKPQLLVLDEVTANLDAANEARLAEWLRALKGRCTAVVVTHREGIIAHADRIVELARTSHLGKD